ncbi:MAG: DNA replication/repair protein RecF [Propionibacteriaceae bacterium]
MFVTALELSNFRSYDHVNLALKPGVTVFVGLNGQGKTNLIEAIDYLATLRSHRVATEAPLVKAGAESAVVRARIEAGLDDSRNVLLEVEITPGKANRARLNRSPLPRTRDILGILRSVVFSPEDLAIIKGDPSERRRFLDELVVSRWPRMAGIKQDYDRVLKQRNALLKAMSGKSRNRHEDSEIAQSTLTVWDEQLASLGAELLAARLDTLTDVVPYAATAYERIAPTNNVIAATYISSIDLAGTCDPASLKEALLQGMKQKSAAEIARGVSLVGPHRDDILLTLGELPAKGYASHGESWSFALALKLGSFELLRADRIEPVLILDDVFAELDLTRRERLAESVLIAEQVLVTAAVGADVPVALSGARFHVTRGQVTSATDQSDLIAQNYSSDEETYNDFLR